MQESSLPWTSNSIVLNAEMKEDVENGVAPLSATKIYVMGVPGGVGRGPVRRTLVERLCAIGGVGRWRLAEAWQTMQACLGVRGAQSVGR